jgi:prophage regulatory protein
MDINLDGGINVTDIAEIKILKRTAVRRKCAIASDQHLHQLVRSRRFPAPIKLGCRSVGWISAEVDAWIRARIAERDARISGAIAVDHQLDEADAQE